MASPMRVLSLCTGIGGIDLAAEAAGMRIVGQVELDEFCNRVLAHHWPHVQRARDLYEVTGDEWGAIDLVVAGFPCQPASLAGKRRGQDDARWLWPEVARIIRACQPAFVLLENVPGLISLGLDDVLGDLDSTGYESAACVYPAATVGAPHERERVFIVAYRMGQPDRQHRHEPAGASNTRWPQLVSTTTSGAELGSNDRTLAYSHSAAQRTQSHRGTKARRQASQRDNFGRCDVVMANATRARLATGQPTRQPTNDTQGGTGVESESAGLSANRQTKSRVGSATHGLPGRLAGHPASSILSHRWPARPGEAQHEWEAPRTVPASDKTPHRAAKLKALGNAVIPQQVYPILAAIAEAWRQMQEVA